MTFLSNAHTHTTFCDGKSTAEEMLSAAQQLGFVSLGFSGHAMQGFDWECCMSVEGQAAYFAQLRAMRTRLSQARVSPKLYIGLEQDAMVPAAEKVKNRAACDYIITSTHYFPESLDGEWVAVDGSAELLLRYIQRHFNGDALAMAQTYFSLHAQAVVTDQPDIIGHFDLVRKYASKIGLDTGCKAYRTMAAEALAKAKPGCNLLEVNTGGIARGYETTPFPSAFLLDVWRDLGGDVTLTSDCHNAAQLDCAFAETLKLLKAHGYRRVLRLGTGTALWDEVPLV